MKKKIKKEDEGKKLPAKVVTSDEGKAFITTVVRTNLNFSGAQNLNAGDLVEHTRLMKVISIRHLDDGSGEVELEIIKRSWSKKY
jgi:hypothetical protein